MKQLDIELHIPIERFVYRTSLGGILIDNVFDKYNYEIETGTYGEKTLTKVKR